MLTKSLREYLDEYGEGHRQRGTRLLHMVGIPMIVVSLPIVPINPLWGGALFAGGWALQWIAHKVFEKNEPKFLSDPLHLLIGVVWTAREWAALFGLELPLPEAP